MHSTKYATYANVYATYASVYAIYANIYANIYARPVLRIFLRIYAKYATIYANIYATHKYTQHIRNIRNQLPIDEIMWRPAGIIPLAKTAGIKNAHADGNFVG